MITKDPSISSKRERKACANTRVAQHSGKDWVPHERQAMSAAYLMLLLRGQRLGIAALTCVKTLASALVTPTHEHKQQPRACFRLWPHSSSMSANIALSCYELMPAFAAQRTHPGHVASRIASE